MRLNEHTLGRGVMRDMTLVLDTGKMCRAAFGWRHWRLKVAALLLRVAGWVLRCEVRIDVPPAGELRG